MPAGVLHISLHWDEGRQAVANKECEAGRPRGVRSTPLQRPPIHIHSSSVVPPRTLRLSWSMPRQVPEGEGGGEAEDAAVARQEWDKEDGGGRPGMRRDGLRRQEQRWRPRKAQTNRQPRADNR